MMPFVGRLYELSVLENEYMKDSSVVIVSGRRGMGKTRLIREFLENKNAVYFLATPTNERRAMCEFNDAVDRRYGWRNSPDSWEGILSRFSGHSNNKKILVIDEFQNMLQFGNGFLGMLRSAWDSVLSKSNVMLILSSSVISAVSPLSSDQDNPMYGAVSKTIELESLGFEDVAGDMDYSDALMLYSLHGGVPGFIAEMYGLSAEGAIDSMMDPDYRGFTGPLETLEGEVKGPSVYLSIMRSIAEGRNRITQISEDLGIPSTTLNSYLKKLLDNGAVRRDVPSTEYLPERSKSGMYTISDAHTAFWLRFIHPHLSELSMGERKGAASDIGAGLEDHIRRVFADICRKMVPSLTGDLGFLPIKHGRYWNRDTDIDIVAINPGKRRALVAGCFLYRDKKVDREDLNDLIDRARKVPELRGYVVKIGMFSVNGFEDDLLAEPNLLLIDKGNPVIHG
jgi:AAA+ ATPase superfamily predicted ATPase